MYYQRYQKRVVSLRKRSTIDNLDIGHEDEVNAISESDTDTILDSIANEQAV